jgi:bifunctional oligoribonuclease and PAP phosphatase NrnA
MKAAYHHAAVALRRAKSVVICAHVRPDGDAIGSALGLTLALRDMGVPAVPTTADVRSAPSTYRWMPGFALYTHADELEAPEVFVALDTPTPERLGYAQDLAEKAGKLVVIDHHPDATEYGDVHVLDSTAAATGQMVWNLVKALELKPTPEIALCCYTALLTDTGRFAFQNTSPQALRDAAEMLEAGVDPSEVAREVYQNRSAASLALETRAMERLTIANGGRVAYTWITDDDFTETGAKPEEAECLPESVRVIEGIQIAILLNQRGPDVRGNLRAKGSYDVAEVARSLGGGGHKAAAGFTAENSSVTEVVQQLLPLLPGGDSA